MMLKKTVLVLLGFFIFKTALAQDEPAGNCGETESKKAKSLVEKAKEKKKYEFEERLKFLRNALEEDAEYVEANYEMGMMQVSLAKGNQTTFKPSEKYLKKAVDACPGQYPVAYYYLGLIAFGGDDFENAAKYMDQFLKNPGDKLKEEDYKKAEEILKKAKFFEQIYKNKVAFEPKLLKSICTYEDEFLPMLSPDNEILLFTHRYMKQGKESLTPKQIEELSISKKAGTEFSKPLPMEKPFNRGDNYGGVTFTLDNKRLYITSCKPNKKGYMNCDIFTSIWNGSEWSELENLGPNVNTEDGWEAQPSLSSDGKTLFFASARTDSKLMDIYKSEKQSDGTWGQAVNLGPEINTDKNEKSPFIHSDSQTLYFTSDGWPGLGSYDIFFTRMGEDKKWSTPKNIGYPINSDNDEVGFFVSTDGNLGYFASSSMKGKGAGGWDIFSFELYKEARPEKIIFVKGVIENKSGESIGQTSLEIKTTQSGNITKIEVDSSSGEYAAVVAIKANEDAVLTVKKKGYAFNSQIIKGNDENIGKPIKINEQIQEVVTGGAYSIKDINYGSNSANLAEESKSILEGFAEYLLENEDLKIEIRGHTDNVGSSSANLALSSDRAFTVMDFLMQKGVPKSRLSFKGYGDTKPIAPNTTPEGKAKNRRTEFVILSK